MVRAGGKRNLREEILSQNGGAMTFICAAHWGPVGGIPPHETGVQGTQTYLRNHFSNDHSFYAIPPVPLNSKIASRSEPSSMFDGMRDKFVDASRAHTSNHIISSGPPNLLRHGPTGKPTWEYRHTNTTHTAHNAMHVCFFGARCWDTWECTLSHTKSNLGS